MAGIIRTILENQRKVTLYEFALREIACIVCEQGHSVIPVLGDNIADRALQEVQRMVKNKNISASPCMPLPPVRRNRHSDRIRRERCSSVTP